MSTYAVKTIEVFIESAPPWSKTPRHTPSMVLAQGLSLEDARAYVIKNATDHDKKQDICVVDEADGSDAYDLITCINPYAGLHKADDAFSIMID